MFLNILINIIIPAKAIIQSFVKINTNYAETLG